MLTGLMTALTLMPSAGAGIDFDVAFASTTQDSDVEVPNPVGHYAFAHTETWVDAKDPNSNQCKINGEYQAKAGPAGVDVGGAYHAEGDSTISTIDHDEDNQAFPFPASVQDQGFEIVFEGESRSTTANALAQSDVAPDAKADDGTSATCEIP